MEKLSGRQLLLTELNESVKENIAALVKSDGFTKQHGRLCCTRCGSGKEADRQEAPCSCGRPCFYCTCCLQMGKIKSCSVLYHLPELNQFQQLNEPILTWKGELSEQQKAASCDIVDAIDHADTRLIWAVTGAGKTEMLFKGIEKALRTKKRVCIASPRVDVCLELAPRLKQAFQEVPQVLLYGKAEEAYRYTQLVICTTHQLLRFKQAFDVLIVDEIDAFPFHSDKSLQFAAGKAKKQSAAVLYLSATPSKQMRRDIQKKKLQATILPARYHRHPLPVPRAVWIGNWRKRLIKRQKNGILFRYIDRLLLNKRRFLLFMPSIACLLQLEKILMFVYPESRFAAVHAEDPERKEKVMAMRNEKIQFLICTTILERGVTFPDIDVLVLGAEDKSFTEAALIQIAGRAGRHKDYPAGEVLYFHYGKSIALKSAISQIIRLNRMAEARGLLI